MDFIKLIVIVSSLAPVCILGTAAQGGSGALDPETTGSTSGF